MTTRQFAQRMGVSQPRVIALEKAETNGTITLETLERAANALDCELVYILLPREPLEKVMNDRAHKAAMRKIASTRHTMALEAQSVSNKATLDQIDRLAREMIEKADKAIWDEK